MKRHPMEKPDAETRKPIITRAYRCKPMNVTNLRRCKREDLELK